MAMGSGAKTIASGVVGIHGFAHNHLRSLLALQAAGRTRLVAAVAHERGRDERWAVELEGAGVRLVPDLDALLAEDLDVITLPVGIDLHLPMALRCLAAGRDVFLEKPAAATVDEVDALIAAEQRSGRRLLVGFQDLFQDATWELKQRLVAGAYGSVQRIVSTTGWPRKRSYFTRNPWAGRLRVAGRPVLDSVANNACAHFLNLGLFLAGATKIQSARPRTVDARLYRGHAIESFDTCSLRIATMEGPEIVFNASHLGATSIPPALRIECSDGVVVNDDLDCEQPWTISADGRDEMLTVAPRHEAALSAALRFLAGEMAPVCRLHHARVHTEVIAALHQVQPIATFPAAQLIAEGDRLFHPDIDRTLREAHVRGCTLEEAGLVVL
jgi:predicted dehydrogenase